MILGIISPNISHMDCSRCLSNAICVKMDSYGCLKPSFLVLSGSACDTTVKGLVSQHTRYSSRSKSGLIHFRSTCLLGIREFRGMDYVLMSIHPHYKWKHVSLLGEVTNQFLISNEEQDVTQNKSLHFPSVETRFLLDSYVNL